MDHNNIIECGGFYFVHCFDSGNLGHVERVPTELIVPSVNHKTNSTESPDYEFNLWTRPDCAGTEFENGNRTWFYFGVQATEPNILVRLNLINLNKQGKMYNQGMAPVTRTLPGKPQWERIRDRPVHSTDDNTFTLTFKYRTSENLKATTFFAFTYPFSFAELQIALNSIDLKMLPLPVPQSMDDIYYHRECVIYSLEGRRVDLLTISSHHGITQEREERLKNLFPDNKDRPYKFLNKKVIFISARVHPGETPSSFVFNGFLNLLLTRHDPIATQLRKLYVFKMIPFLNPDGVARGHYRTDTRGVNLNRVYLNPSLTYHPTVYASRALIRYYHFGCEREDTYEDSKSFISHSIHNISESSEIIDIKKKKLPSMTSYKSNEFSKRDKERSNKQLTGNKSTCTLKQPSTSDHSKRDFKALSDATTLVDQVNEMKLQEMTSQNDVPLNDTILRNCLGCDVHVTASEELRLLASNPLRPLRDTLKNSISLLMDSPLSGDADTGSKENVRLGWCRSCRGALARLEDAMPGYSAMVPGYTLTMSRSASPTYSNIDEYREHQRVQYDTYERKMQEYEEAKDDTVYFCTNCFKRYTLSENNEEIVQVCGVGSRTSEAGSGAPDASEGSEGSGGSGGSRSLDASPAAGRRSPDSGTGDAATESPPRTKTEKSKNPVVKQMKKKPVINTAVAKPKEPESGLYLYIDLHGHASKKGIFMYGNHFDELESSVECMLLPRIMSLNNLHFHFSSCNFTERNMYLKDRRDGMSREGSGRVAVYKATGLVRSYTLECNYNTGRLVNVLPPASRDAPHAPAPHAHAHAPPKYTPHIFEEVGVSLGASILDLTGQHPNSRVPASEHRSLPALRDWLRTHTRTMRPQLTMSRLRPKTSSPSRVPLYSRGKTKTEERKENTYLGAKTDSDRGPPLPPQRPADTKYAKKNEPTETDLRTRYLTDNEPKPKTMTSKRRSILAIRKPNASKTQVVKKISRRSADDAESRQTLASGKLSKSFSRSRASRAERRRAGSSSSEELGAWEGARGAARAPDAPPAAPAPPARRRPFPAPHAPLSLKKIRLKTGL